MLKCRQLLAFKHLWAWYTTTERLKARNFFICRYFKFMSCWNFMLSWVEHEKSFITSGSRLYYVALWMQGCVGILTLMGLTKNLFNRITQGSRNFPCLKSKWVWPGIALFTYHRPPYHGTARKIHKTLTATWQENYFSKLMAELANLLANFSFDCYNAQVIKKVKRVSNL